MKPNEKYFIKEGYNKMMKFKFLTDLADDKTVNLASIVGIFLAIIMVSLEIIEGISSRIFQSRTKWITLGILIFLWALCWRRYSQLMHVQLELDKIRLKEKKSQKLKKIR